MISKKSVGGQRGNTAALFGVVGPEKEAILCELLAEYDRGNFLAELWKVRKLLEQHSESPPRVRSRTGAKTPLFRTLANLNLARLREIHEEMALRRSGKSDLDIIADAILRRTG